MSNIRVDNIRGHNSINQITLNSSGRPTIQNLQVNLICRNGADSSLPLITLSSYNDVHLYTSNENNSLIYLRTSLVSNSLYELWIISAPGSSNVDPGFYPNGSSYSGEFTQSYRATNDANNAFDRRLETLERFWFDHQGGGSGNVLMEHVICSTGPTNKYMQFEGADNGPSLSTGYGRWTNDSRTWDWFGYINFAPHSSSFKRAAIRRIG